MLSLSFLLKNIFNIAGIVISLKEHKLYYFLKHDQGDRLIFSNIF